MLPDLIEIIPLASPVQAEITVPGSKSITNRALILAALAEGEVTLQGALWSEDTQIMVECLHQLGFDVKVVDDPAEFCNRTITVKGLGGIIPKAGTPDQPLELFVGNAGTAARFLAAFVCLGQGVYRLSGVPRMHERPQAALFQALRELGYQVEAPGDKLPAVITGTGPKPGAQGTVSIAKSSQFASALKLSAKRGSWEIKVVGENEDESPYVVMTEKLMKEFPEKDGTFQIEPDSSSGSYFLGAGWLLGKFDLIEGLKNGTMPLNAELSSIHVPLWPTSRWQIDSDFIKLTTLNYASGHNPINYNDPENFVTFPTKISRSRDLGDSIMTQIALAPLLLSSKSPPVAFTDLGRLRVQECERVVALQTELRKCGAEVKEEVDTLMVSPSQLHGAEIATYNDHRMAMCFAILGLKVPGIKIQNPACVKKTFPNFFQKLAAPPPNGLGAEIWEIKNGRRTRKLSGDDLFAG